MTARVRLVIDPQLLLEAWREAYQFDKHTLIQGHQRSERWAGLAIAGFGNRLRFDRQSEGP